MPPRRTPVPLQRLFRHMNPPVWFGSAGVIVAFVLYGTLATESAQASFKALHGFILDTFGWFYILTATGILAFILWLAASPYAKLRLGPPGSKPEFSTFAWFTMVFAAGMGTGLVFWSVAEPMQHVLTAPPKDFAGYDRAETALFYTFFHWGLHPWAIYVLFGSALAYFHFRKGLPLAPRSLLYPLLGKAYNGWAGHITDILCTVGTLFGVATSLGLGAMQINSGIAQLSGLGINLSTQVLLIVLITSVATTSVLLGLHNGISVLSRLNILLALLLVVFLFLAGPSVRIIEVFVTSLGHYVQYLPGASLWLEGGEDTWQKDWTLFYWSWWISWSPFVGVFTARISKGRTLREYILGVMVLPVATIFLWLATFGGTGLEAYLGGQLESLGNVAETTPELALHHLLKDFPLSQVTSVLTTLLITIFFITSSDSGSFVDDIVTSGGDPNPPRIQRVFWALAEGAVAATLLIAGGLEALRTASLSWGLPMAVLLILTAIAFLRDLRREFRAMKASGSAPQ